MIRSLLNTRDFPGGGTGKNPPANAVMQEMRVWSLGQEDVLEEEMATQSSILARKNSMDSRMEITEQRINKLKTEP